MRCGASDRLSVRRATVCLGVALAAPIAIAAAEPSGERATVPFRTGRVGWGDGRALRIFADTRLIASRDSERLVSVHLWYEGREEFAVDPKDSWTVVPETGPPVPAVLWDPSAGKPRKAVVIREADGVVSLLLRADTIFDAPIRSLRYRKAKTGIEVEANRTLLQPEALGAVAPSFPPDEAIRPNAWRSIRVGALVGADGRVRDGRVEPKCGSGDAKYCEEALRAFEKWRFEPAREDGAPIPWRVSRTFEFSTARAARAVVEGPVSAVSRRIESALRGGPATAVVALPTAGGFAVRGRTQASDGGESTRLFLVRYGREPGEAEATWVSLAAVAFTRRTSSLGRSRGEWEPDPSAADGFLAWLRSALGVPSRDSGSLAARSWDEVPSGLQEAPTSRSWNRQALLWLAEREAAGPEPSLPTEADLLRPEPQPMPLAPDMTPPVRILKVDPEYPEEARRRKIEGFVVVVATIDENGAVLDPFVAKSADRLLDRAAMEAVSRWRYLPAKRNGEPVRILFAIRIDFNLN